ncbi:hypothetical protein NKH18_30290 [Streptomyces sp. M10(2022)]
MSKTTSDATPRSAVAADWALDPADADACERLARALCAGGHDQVDSPEWVAGPGTPGRAFRSRCALRCAGFGGTPARTAHW